MADPERELVYSGVDSAETSLGGNAAAEMQSAPDSRMATFAVVTDLDCTLVVEKWNARSGAWGPLVSQAITAPGQSVVAHGYHGRMRASLTRVGTDDWNASVTGAST